MIEMYNEIPEHRENNLIQAYSYDVGFDIRAGQACKIPPRTSSPLLYTGLHICFPCWLCGHIRPRSHQIKRDILTDGTIDPGYTGAIRVKLFNFSWSEPYQFEKGEKIAQLKIEIAPEGFFNEFLSQNQNRFNLGKCYFEIKEVPKMEWVNTDRGSKGFNSSGVV